jgi:hypothetical protein
VPDFLIRASRLPQSANIASKFMANGIPIAGQSAPKGGLKKHNRFEFCLGIAIAHGSSQLNSSLLLDKGKPVARLGRKAKGQAN